MLTPPHVEEVRFFVGERSGDVTPRFQTLLHPEEKKGTNKN